MLDASTIRCSVLLLVVCVTPGCISPLVWTSEVQAFGLYSVSEQSHGPHHDGISFRGFGVCRTRRGVSLGYQSVRLVCADTSDEGTAVDLDGLQLATGATAEALARTSATQ